MSAEDSKAVMRRLYEEVFNQGKVELADELIADRDPGIYVWFGRWLADHGSLFVDHGERFYSHDGGFIAQ